MSLRGGSQKLKYAIGKVQIEDLNYKMQFVHIVNIPQEKPSVLKRRLFPTICVHALENSIISDIIFCLFPLSDIEHLVVIS